MKRFQPGPHDASNERIRHWFIERKPQVPLLPLVLRERFLQRGVARDGREHPDVMLEWRDVDDDPAIEERRHAVAGPLLGSWCLLTDDRENLPQDRPGCRRCLCDVFIDRRTSRLRSRLHLARCPLFHRSQLLPRTTRPDGSVQCSTFDCCGGTCASALVLSG